MFRAELKSKFSMIFGFKKTTFDAPSPDAIEQDTLFIQIDDSPSRITQGKSYAEVSGTLLVFSQIDKIPYGFFNKKIQEADPFLTKDIFFYNIDSTQGSAERFQNLLERRIRFVYLYSDQYDPANGSITSLEVAS